MIYILNGMSVRFEYNRDKLRTSSINGNTLTDNADEYFQFVDEFGIKDCENENGDTVKKKVLELKNVNDTGKENVILALITFMPPVETSEHIKEIETIIDGETKQTKVISTRDSETNPDEESDTGDLLIGTMSFSIQKDAEGNFYDFDMSEIKLVGGLKSDGTPYNTPKNGAKINIDAAHSYEEVSLESDEGIFRFTDATASKDADLKDLVLSSGELNTTDYKEYTLSPIFDKQIKEYEVTLLEYIHIINITATQNDEKATMKMKIPNRDEDGNIVYESDGTTIQYDETKTQDLENGVPIGVTLNKLGEQDTIVAIEVTAEDRKTTNTYIITIKRPYGTITGSVYVSPTASLNKHKATIRLYNLSDTETVVDWGNIVSGEADNLHEKLIELDSQNYETNNDGTYEIYVIPGTYTILIDKDCYLDYIYSSRTIEQGKTENLGKVNLIAGDVNKDGVVQLRDLTSLMSYYGVISENIDDYNENIGLDFNEDEAIQLRDLTILMSSYGEYRVVE